MNLVLAAVFFLPGMLPASAGSFQSLVRELDTIRQEHGVAGFALTLVTAGGDRRTAVGGLADLERQIPVTDRTLFRIGSITKTFNAMAIMLLVEDGRLSLDTPVREIVPDVRITNPWADRKPVRVIHLLEHSSGLLDISREEFDHNKPFNNLEAAFAFRPDARVVQWQPGLHAVYSNANAGLIGLVIERVSGKSYARFVTERLLQPMGMSSAGLLYDKATRQRLAIGYDSDGQTPIPYWHMIFPPLGAINASPEDMGALVEVLLRRGTVGEERLLDGEAVERMETPSSTLGMRYGLNYGYGLGLDQTLRDGFLWYGHGGDGDGYLSHFAYNRNAKAGYFITINAFKHAPLNAMKARIQNYLVRSLPTPPTPPSDVKGKALRSLTGLYVAVTRRFEWEDPAGLSDDSLRLVMENGTLYTRTSNGRSRLIPVDAHRFRREGETLATIAIAPQDGELYLQADFGNYRKVAEIQ